MYVYVYATCTTTSTLAQCSDYQCVKAYLMKTNYNQFLLPLSLPAYPTSNLMNMLLLIFYLNFLL